MTFPRLGLLSITAALYLWQQDHSVQVSTATATAPNVDPHADGGAPEALRRLFPTAFRPAAFHEQERDAAVASGDSYFEGWYFKSEADTGEVLALIPGIMHSRDASSSAGENVNGSHAFVIVFDGARASKTDFPIWPRARLRVTRRKPATDSRSKTTQRARILGGATCTVPGLRMVSRTTMLTL